MQDVLKQGILLEYYLCNYSTDCNFGMYLVLLNISSGKHNQTKLKGNMPSC